MTLRPPLIGDAGVNVQGRENFVIAGRYSVHNGPSVSISDVISRQQSPQPRSPHRSNEGTTSPPSTRSSTPPLTIVPISVVYTRGLVPKKIGFPLWRPSPIESDPADFRTNGVRIGDLGVITPEGRFKYLFSIRRQPEGADRGPSPQLPHDLVDINQQDIETDHCYFKAGDHTKSEDYKHAFRHSSRVSHDWLSEAEYNSFSSQGAVLHLPTGGIKKELTNKRVFRTLAAKHAAVWYRIAYDMLGEDDLNGSLYLVTGHIKSSSWAAAAHQSSLPDVHVSLNLQASRVDNTTDYYWAHEGVAETRVGPTPVADSATPNQCLFLQGFKIKLRFSQFAGIQWGLGVNMSNVTDDTDLESVLPERCTLPQSSKSSPKSGDSGYWSGPPSPRDHLEFPFSYSEAQLFDLQAPEGSKNSGIYHPLDALNDYLLEQTPEAQIAITHDHDWMHLTESGTSDGDVFDPDFVIRSASSQYRKVVELGAVSLEHSSEVASPVGSTGESEPSFIETSPLLFGPASWPNEENQYLSGLTLPDEPAFPNLRDPWDPLDLPVPFEDFPPRSHDYSYETYKQDLPSSSKKPYKKPPTRNFLPLRTSETYERYQPKPLRETSRTRRVKKYVLRPTSDAYERELARPLRSEVEVHFPPTLLSPRKMPKRHPLLSSPKFSELESLAQSQVVSSKDSPIPPSHSPQMEWPNPPKQPCTVSLPFQLPSAYEKVKLFVRSRKYPKALRRITHHHPKLPVCSKDIDTFHDYGNWSRRPQRTDTWVPPYADHHASQVLSGVAHHLAQIFPAYLSMLGREPYSDTTHQCGTHTQFIEHVAAPLLFLRTHTERPLVICINGTDERFGRQVTDNFIGALSSSLRAPIPEYVIQRLPQEFIRRHGINHTTRIDAVIRVRIVARSRGYRAREYVQPQNRGRRARFVHAVLTLSILLLLISFGIFRLCLWMYS